MRHRQERWCNFKMLPGKAFPMLSLPWQTNPTARENPSSDVSQILREALRASPTAFLRFAFGEQLLAARC